MSRETALVPELLPEERRMPFWDHVGELRERLLKSVGALAAATAAAYACRFELWELAQRPLTQALRSRAPLSALGSPFAFADASEPFLTLVRLSFWTAVLGVSPVLFYQAWAFVRPALRESEKRLVVPVAAATSLCFVAGAAFGYLVGMPLALGFLLDEAARAGMRPVLRPALWLDLLTWTLLGCGIAFEGPVLAWVLGRLGLVTAAGMLRWWREAIVVILALSAFLTPGDVLAATVLFGGALVVLYFVSIAAAFVAER